MRIETEDGRFYENGEPNIGFNLFCIYETDEDGNRGEVHPSAVFRNYSQWMWPIVYLDRYGVGRNREIYLRKLMIFGAILATNLVREFDDAD